MKKVVMYGKHRKLPLFVGTETECRAWIMRQASEHIKYTNADGKEVMLVRELHDPDGIAYDVGQPVMYQIVEVDGNDTEGIEQDL
jgi:hypothetical protein